MNNNGQVIAIGVPESAAYALMLAGLGLLGLMARCGKVDGTIRH
ncbi:PEP-CTERM sorting domain-containing protein [Nitrosospira sp. Nsp14]